MKYLQKMTPPDRAQIAGAALVLALTVAGILMYRGLATWLVVSSSVPEKVDVIFTFGGENVRDSYSRALAEMHPEAAWVLSTYSSSAEARALSRSEFDTSKVTLVDTLRNTWEELRFLRAWLAAHPPAAPAAQSSDSTAVSPAPPAGPRKVLLVSGPYHMRRIKIGVVRLLNDRTLEFAYAPVPFELYNQSATTYRFWWRDKSLARLVKLEFVKALYYLVRL